MATIYSGAEHFSAPFTVALDARMVEWQTLRTRIGSLRSKGRGSKASNSANPIFGNAELSLRTLLTPIRRSMCVTIRTYYAEIAQDVVLGVSVNMV